MTTLVIAGCSSDPLVVPAASGPTLTAASTTTTATVATAAPTTTAVPVTTVPGPLRIEVDASSAQPTRATAALGSTVELHISSSVTDEFHLHGYDLESQGVDVTMTFTATKAGEFDLEGHVNENVILILTVG